MFPRTAIPFVLPCLVAGGFFALTAHTSIAQTPATAAPAPLPPPKPSTNEQVREKTVPAKQLFGEKKLPSLGRAMAIGYYPRGCLSGGIELPVNGSTW